MSEAIYRMLMPVWWVPVRFRPLQMFLRRMSGAVRLLSARDYPMRAVFRRLPVPFRAMRKPAR